MNVHTRTCHCGGATPRPSQIAQKAMIRPNRSPGLLLPVLVSALLVACGSEKPTNGPPPPAAVPVSVVTLKAANVTLTRELPGRVAPSVVAEVRPQVSGVVQSRLFQEGGLIKAGQPLYQLDDATYRADYNSAQATLARAEATLRAAQLTARRSTELAKIQAISVQDNENAIAALRQAEADVGVSKAALESRRVVLDHARISSPIGGRIGKSSVTQGALVTAAQATPLAVVQKLDPVFIDLSQSSGELLQLRQELATGKLQQSTVPVTILLEDGSQYQHPGRLAFSELTVDPSTGSFALRVVAPNPDNLLLPGAYVRAVVGNGQRRDGLLVPQTAIARDPKGNATALVVKDGKVESRAVQVSRTLDDQWLVDGGLTAGEQVIVEGVQKVKPGAAVTATEAVPAKSKSAAVGPQQSGQTSVGKER